MYKLLLLLTQKALNDLPPKYIADLISIYVPKTKRGLTQTQPSLCRLQRSCSNENMWFKSVLECYFITYYYYYYYYYYYHY